jgi:hypothetical protein
MHALALTALVDRYNHASIEHVPLRIAGALDGSYALNNALLILAPTETL